MENCNPPLPNHNSFKRRIGKSGGWRENPSALRADVIDI